LQAREAAAMAHETAGAAIAAAWDEELVDLPEAEKEADPLRRARIRRDIGGQEYCGWVEDIEVGKVTGERLYRVRYEDEDLEHYPLDRLREFLDKGEEPPPTQELPLAPTPRARPKADAEAVKKAAKKVEKAEKPEKAEKAAKPEKVEKAEKVSPKKIAAKAMGNKVATHTPAKAAAAVQKTAEKPAAKGPGPPASRARAPPPPPPPAAAKPPEPVKQAKASSAAAPPAAARAEAKAGRLLATPQQRAKAATAAGAGAGAAAATCASSSSSAAAGKKVHKEALKQKPAAAKAKAPTRPKK